MSRAFIFKGKENELPVSHKMSTDPFDGYYGDGIIEPPYNLDWLARLPEHSGNGDEHRRLWLHSRTCVRFS